MAPLERWMGEDGSLWLFGGYGFGISGSSYLGGMLNDLWKFDRTSDQWTWMAGSNQPNDRGAYGVQGVPDPANVPAGRQDALAFTDTDGNLLLFGGSRAAPLVYSQFDIETIYQQSNDLWKFDTTSNEWTWLKGSSQPKQRAVEGTPGIANPGNIPSARSESVGWTTPSDEIWLFSGEGELHDLWSAAKPKAQISDWTIY